MGQLTYETERTTIAGTVKHEVNCIAVVNEESDRILAQRTTEAMKPKRHTKFLNEDLSTIGTGFIQPGTIHAQNTFTDFIVCILPSSQSQYLTFCRKPKILPRVHDHNLQRLPVCPKTSFWIVSLNASRGIITGL